MSNMLGLRTQRYSSLKNFKYWLDRLGQEPLSILGEDPQGQLHFVGKSLDWEFVAVMSSFLDSFVKACSLIAVVLCSVMMSDVWRRSRKLSFVNK